jgi:hypothetical protein
MNMQQKKSCEFISTNVWLRILVVEDMGYTVYRVTTSHTHGNNKMPVVVLLWYHDKHMISVHREGEGLHIITGVQLREQTVNVKLMLYKSHTMCSLEVEPDVEISCDRSAMWNLRPQDALRFIIHCIARDILVERGANEDDTRAHETLTVFSAFPMWLIDSKQDRGKGTKALSFCTRYDGQRATTYVHGTEDGRQWASVDEETIASKDACSHVLDIYNGICMPDGKAPLLKILTKWTTGMIDHRYACTENVRRILVETTDDFFTKACAVTPFCRVDESTESEGYHCRLTLCLASEPNDACIQLRLTLHRFMKANISRSLNTCIEAVLD